MNIFRKIQNSIYNPSYYDEMAEKPFSSAFKYLLMFALLFALVFTVVVTIKSAPIVKMLSDVAPEVANYFPEDLVIMINDGKASTNVQEPYFIKIPDDWKGEFKEDSGQPNIENLFVIDTKNEFDLNSFASYKTIALLSVNSITYVEDSGKISIVPLSGIDEFLLNRDVVAGLVEKVRPFIALLYPLIFVGAFLIGYLMVISKMFYLLFGALAIWLVAKVKGLKIGYKQSYKLGMYLITGPIIITSFLTLISHKFTFVFLFTILLVIMAVLNLKKSIRQVATTT